MQYRPLGRTGLNLSVLGFGAAPLGGLYGAIDDDEAIRAVHAAIDLGVNFFDVSPCDGDGRAEALLGKALRAVPRNRYLLATKVGRYGEHEFDFSYVNTHEKIGRSLERLGVGHFDLVHCQDVEFADLEQITRETIPALISMRWTGKVRLVGVSGLPLNVLRGMVERVPGGIDAVLSYCHHTLLDDSLKNLLDFLAPRHVGAINAAPLGMGLLTNQGPPPWHPAPAPIRDACAQAAAYCRANGADISQLALQFAMSDPRITTTLVGMSSVREVQSNVGVACGSANPELPGQVAAILAAVHNQSWPSGRPENN